MPCLPGKAFDPTTPMGMAGMSSTRRHPASSRSPQKQLEPLGRTSAWPGMSHMLQQTIWLLLFCKDQGKICLQRLQQVS